ncbi:hypothetical protein [Agromyces sp. NBRC 114283]|nr:hypothetical protein [Agromyces sp. NBRC 114283]GLU88948.1 hypothetical protein Agsp01_12030 [Agromyces sp. NBRC 114283]
MGKFINTTTQVVVSVADEKDDRFTDGWERYDPAAKRGPGRPKKSE